MNQIHPLAVVDPEAKLGDNNVIAPVPAFLPNPRT